jgi:hypothetical protein
MEIKEEKKAIKNLKASYMEDWDLTEDQKDDLDALVYRVLMVGKEEGKQQATPEGFVLVPKVLPSEINDQVWDDYLTPQCVVNEDGFSFISCEDFDLDALYQTLLKAQEQSHD